MRSPTPLSRVALWREGLGLTDGVDAVDDRNVVLDEPIAKGLRYTEEVKEHEGWSPQRRCCLWKDGEPRPVSDLELLSIRFRFGATALAVEGVGGVQTQLHHQRKGYMRILMSRALDSARTRVCAAFLFGTPDLYPRWGFATCAPKSRVKLQIADFSDLTAIATVRCASIEDLPSILPSIVQVYNRAHRSRPWTLEREPTWNHLSKAKVWEPGSEVYVHEDHGSVAAYAFVRGHSPRDGHRNMVVDELGAVDPEAAAVMLRSLASICWVAKREQFTVLEPIDSPAGVAARRLRCEVTTQYFVDSDCMGVILDRGTLVAGLETELQRRASRAGVDARRSANAIALLRSGHLVPDDGELLRLMVGYEAAGDGTGESAERETLLGAWFPGGGSPALPIPYAHRLDYY